MKMYVLEHSKEENVISVKKANKAFQNLNFKEEVTFYNDNYYFCKNRKPLIEKAREIREKWILELEQSALDLERRLEELKEMKI